jgi:TRAP-type mannitol/chloroaromatic compound transport system substrate-binding protein
VEAASTSNTALAMENYSTDLRRLRDEMGVTVHRTSTEILQGQLDAWDGLIAELEQDEFSKRVMDSQRAWVEKVAYYELMNAPDLALAYEHYFPGRLAL